MSDKSNPQMEWLQERIALKELEARTLRYGSAARIKLDNEVRELKRFQAKLHARVIGVADYDYWSER